MSNKDDKNEVVSMADVKKQVAETLSSSEWKLFADAQGKQLELLRKENSVLKAKTEQLEHLLKQKTPGLVQPLTPEEIICIEQIDRLRYASQTRELGLEEVKRLDLLVKNLKIIREESTVIVKNTHPESMKEADLVAIIQSDSTPSNTEGS